MFRVFLLLLLWSINLRLQVLPFYIYRRGRKLSIGAAGAGVYISGAVEPIGYSREAGQQCRLYNGRLPATLPTHAHLEETCQTGRTFSRKGAANLLEIE